MNHQSDMVEANCVRSGWCCQQAPCPFGEAEEGGTACIHLVGDEPGEYECGRFDEIMAMPPEMGAEVAPAFGAGCCSNFNPVRIALLSR